MKQQSGLQAAIRALSNKTQFEQARQAAIRDWQRRHHSDINPWESTDTRTLTKCQLWFAAVIKYTTIVIKDLAKAVYKLIIAAAATAILVYATGIYDWLSKNILA